MVDVIVVSGPFTIRCEVVEDVMHLFVAELATPIVVTPTHSVHLRVENGRTIVSLAAR